MGNSKPIMCTLSAAELGTRGVRWDDALRKAGAQISSVPDGATITFKNDADLREIQELVRAENECCAWMNLDLRRSEKSAVLSITADSDEGVQLIREMVRLSA